MKKAFWIVLILLIVLGILYLYFIGGNQLRAARGIDQGENFVSKLYSDYGIVGKTCQGEDSNKDGYVTCNFRLVKNTNQNEEKVITIHCPTFIKSYLGTSCKQEGLLINPQ